MFDHHVHHHHHYGGGDAIPPWAAVLQRQNGIIIKRIDDMAKTLQDIIDQGNATLAQVTTNTDLDNSIIAIVNAQAATLTDLRAQLAAAGTDAAKLAELGDVMDQLAAKTVAEGVVTAEAVKANTAAAPTA